MTSYNSRLVNGRLIFSIYLLFILFIALVIAIGAYGNNSVPVSNDIDKYIQDKWKANNLKPSDKSSDAEYIRRVYIDLLGRIPNAAEVKSFLNDKSPDKRSKKTDELLESPEFGQNLADIWINILFTQENLQKFPVKAYSYLRNYYADFFNGNKPYDEFVYNLVSARGLATTDPNVLFISKFTTPEDAAGNVMKIFTGRRIQCAQCHKHPYENITQDDFYGVAAFFARTRAVPLLKKDAVEKITKLLGRYDKVIKRARDKEMTETMESSKDMPEDMQNEKGHNDLKKNKNEGKKKKDNKKRLIPPEWVSDTLLAKLNRSKDGAYVPDVLVWDAVNGQIEYTNKAGEKKLVAPKYLGGASVPTDGSADRRQLLAKYLTSQIQQDLAKAFVVRAWKHFFGYSFINPIDEITDKDDGSNPELLNYLTSSFVSSGFNIKSLFKQIVNTEAYQLSSTPNETNKEDHDYFSRAVLRPMSPIQLSNSLLTTSGYMNLKSLQNKDADEIEKIKIRLMRLFVFTFNDDEMSEAENFSGTITQALMMMNSDITQKITDKKPGNIVAQVINEYNEPADRIDMLYLNTLSRFPDKNEKAKLLTKAGDSKEFYEDLQWALINSSEFIFNH